MNAGRLQGTGSLNPVNLDSNPCVPLLLSLPGLVGLALGASCGQVSLLHGTAGPSGPERVRVQRSWPSAGTERVSSLALPRPALLQPMKEPGAFRCSEVTWRDPRRTGPSLGVAQSPFPLSSRPAAPAGSTVSGPYSARPDPHVLWRMGSRRAGVGRAAG